MSLQRKFEGLEVDHTYASFANATKALARACDKIGITTEVLQYVIAATPTGRFYPVFLPTSDQVQLAICFAQHGVSCIRI